MSLKNLYENMPSEEIIRRMKMEDFSTHCRTQPQLNDPVLFPTFVSVFVSVGLAPIAVPLAAVATAVAMTSLTRGVQVVMRK